VRPSKVHFAPNKSLNLTPQAWFVGSRDVFTPGVGQGAS
jgi:hypothetical protein